MCDVIVIVKTVVSRVRCDSDSEDCRLSYMIVIVKTVVCDVIVKTVVSRV